MVKNNIWTENVGRSLQKATFCLTFIVQADIMEVFVFKLYYSYLPKLTCLAFFQ